MSAPIPNHLKGRLLECSRRSCSYILLESEQNWIPNKDTGGKTAVCPNCGRDSFYSLNEKGQRLTFKQREEYGDDVVIANIEPTSSMGSKRKANLLSAKERAARSAKEREPV